jgi:glutaredoxin
MRLAVAILVACAASAAAAQQIYRWTDKDGRTHITDTPPPPDAKEVVQKKPQSNSTVPQVSENEPYALQVARKNYPVTLYTSPDCEACGDARQLLSGRGVPFTEIIVSDERSFAELRRLVGSYSVPAILVGAMVQKGFEQSMYNRMLDAAGYPKAGILPARAQAEPKSGETESKPAEVQVTPRGPYAPGAPRQPSYNR